MQAIYVLMMVGSAAVFMAVVSVLIVTAFTAAKWVIESPGGWIIGGNEAQMFIILLVAFAIASGFGAWQSANAYVEEGGTSTEIAVIAITFVVVFLVGMMVWSQLHRGREAVREAESILRNQKA